MINRIYVDNYKTLVNFEINLDSINVFMGRNGSGKSSTFEIVSGLRSIISEHEPIGKVFGMDTLTRWQNRLIQTMELSLEID